jgi:hypothetical protein
LLKDFAKYISGQQNLTTQRVNVSACMIFTWDQWIARDARVGKANCSLYPQAVMRKILKL